MKLNHKGKNIIKLNSNMSVVIELEAFKKMQCYIDLCSKEVGWLGTAYKEGSVIRIKDVFLFDQEVHATTCELTPGGIADFVTNLYMTMDSDDAMEISNNLTCWGHSHVNMGVSPSGQDDIQLRSFSSSGHEWFLRVIGNKRGEYEYTYIDYTTGIEIRDIDWRVEIPGLEMDTLKTEIKSEMDVKVREKKYETKTFYGGVTRGRNYISNPSGYASLLDDDYFDQYIKSQSKIEYKQKKEEEKEETNILAGMAASDNHDSIMSIVGGNTDNITDTEYQILDEALCHLVLDELQFISTCNTSEAGISFIKDVTGDFFTVQEMYELYEICRNYRKNLAILNVAK